MTDASFDSLSPTLRKDLQSSQVRMGRCDYVVIKDPLSRAYFHFTQREWAILELLDGRRTFAEIVTQCATQFAPDFVSPEALIQFLSEANSASLLHSTPRQGPQTNANASRRSLLSNPLAIRLPGINPDSALNAFIPFARLIFVPIFLAAWFVLVAIAMLTILLHFESFTQHVANSAQHQSVAWWLTIAAVISVTKIIHELAHATTCKLFGGECRELGIMLLLGVPCLYCDVSDAWMIPQRWKRILISAAGMLAELAIAAVAVLLWRNLDPGNARDLCVTVIVVCSVSTLVFNGNPLLRYDGYFILSDLLGIPNLASQARQSVRGWMRRVIWDTPQQPLCGESYSRQILTFTYGVLSGLYRLAIMGVIIWMAHQWLAGRGLTHVADLLAFAVIAMATVRLTRPILQRPQTTTGSGWRPVIVAFAGIGILALALFVPLPRSVKAPLMVQPSKAVPIYVATAGQVTDAIGYHSDLDAGDNIARLENRAKLLQLQQQRTRRDEQQVLVDVLRKRQVSDPAAAAQIPAAQDQLASIQERCNLLQRDIDQLSIASPISGRLFPPPRRAESDDSRIKSVAWREMPLILENRGAMLFAGTLIGTVGDPKLREAVLMIDEADISLIELEQSVELLSAHQPSDPIEGKVTEISTSPVEDIAAEYYAAALIPPELVPPNPSSPKSIYYQVRVKLSESARRLPIRSVHTSRIRVRSASVFQRIAERYWR